MGMTGHLLRVSHEELDTYLADSSLLEDRIYNSEAQDEHLLDVDKAWEGIIFLLTGKNIQTATSELVQIFFSGDLIDEEQDLGMGPAHYLTNEQVVNLNNQISSLTEADLKHKYDPNRMKELSVYPDIWDEGEEAFDYIYVNFVALQTFYSEAAKNGEAIITFIS